MVGWKAYHNFKYNRTEHILTQYNLKQKPVKTYQNET